LQADARILEVNGSKIQKMSKGKDAEKKIAQALFVHSDMKQKEIADKVRVSEKTIGKWISEGKWEALKAAKNTTREAIISKKYKLLEGLVDNNLQKQEQGTLTTGDIDAEHKLSMSIKSLQNEETLSGYIQAFTPFLKYVQEQDPATGKKLAEYSQSFLLSKSSEL
jgi:transposase